MLIKNHNVQYKVKYLPRLGWYIIDVFNDILYAGPFKYKREALFRMISKKAANQ